MPPVVALFVTVVTVDAPSGGPICYCTDSGPPPPGWLYLLLYWEWMSPPQWWPNVLLTVDIPQLWPYSLLTVDAQLVVPYVLLTVDAP